MALNGVEPNTDNMAMAPRHHPSSLLHLPEGRSIELAGRGPTWARVLEGDGEGLPVLLLHGWTATADLTWAGTYEALWPSRTVVAPDHHGHGRGLRHDEPFSIEQAADDAVAVLKACGQERAIVVGYSMGGAVAQHVARRHPGAVAGLVLCATSAHFCATARDRMGFRVLGRAASALRPAPATFHRSVASAFLRAKHGDAAGVTGWIADELNLHHWPTVLEAGMAIGDHDSRAWIGELEAPAVVVTTSDDRVVPTARQLALARLLPTATVEVIGGSHDVCLRAPAVLAGAVARACHRIDGAAAVPSVRSASA